MNQSIPQFQLDHIAMNTSGKAAAADIVSFFTSAFAFSAVRGTKSTIVADLIEVVHGSYLGTHGHIAIATPNIDRAVLYLESQGIAFDQTTVEYDDFNRKRVIYLKNELASFAVHLVRKDIV